MLVKTSVARKFLRQAWRLGDPVGRDAFYKIDAMQHFGVSLEASTPESSIGFHDQFLVANVDSYLRHHDLITTNTHYAWRSRVKHDCSKVMELTKGLTAY